MPRRAGTIAGAVVAGAGWIAAAWLYWGPLLRRLPDHSVDGIVKDYYLSDQLAYLSIARNVSVGLSPFVEPFTATGSSIYPSAYYWILGRFADVGSTTVFAAWNVVGMAVTLALLAMATAWAVWCLPGTRAWVLAPAALMVGTLEWFTSDGHWSAAYGEHAVLWAPYGSLFSPGAEGFALLWAGLCLMAVCSVLIRPAGRRRLLVAGVAGVLLGLVLVSHTYVAMFAATAVVMVVVAHEVVLRPQRRAVVVLGAAMAVVLVASGVLGGSGAVTRLAIVIATPLAWLATRREWRRELGAPALALAGAALATGSPLLVRIAAQIADPDSFFYLRQELAETRDLGLPAGAVLFQFGPLWLLAGAAIVALARREREPRETAWLSALAGLLVATVLLTFNDAWGFDTEPYRFLPYGTFLLAVAAMPWLWSALAAGPRLVNPTRGAGVGVAMALGLTVPTTLAFTHDTADLVFAFPRGEREAYARVADVTGDGLALYDACFRPDLVKVGGGGRVVYENVGLAIPAHHEEIGAILAAVATRRLPADAALEDTGIAWFVSTNHCEGVGAAELRRRFGAPRGVPLGAGAAAGLGAPADLTYEVYRVGGTRS